VSKRFIVLAATKRAGEQATKILGINTVAIITPRTKYAAYGISADCIHDDSSLTPHHRDELVAYARPSIATTRDA